MLNKVEIIGRIGQQPKIMNTQTGQKVARLSIGCSFSWKDKDGNKQEHTDWIPVVVFGHSANYIDKYCGVGDLVYACGSFRTRKYSKDGKDVYTTEVVVQNMSGQFDILNSKNKKDVQEVQQEIQADDMIEDDIPF